MRFLKKRPPKDIAAFAVFIGVLALLVFSVYWAFVQFQNTPPYVDEKKYPIRGIDVSRHNGDIDYKKVADSGIEFVFIKASEGSTHRDSLYYRNMTEANSAGLETGAYHFFRFDKEGVEQAVNFLQTIGPHKPSLGLVIDVEKTGNPDNIDNETVRSRLTSMIEYMNLLGYRVMIYTNLEGYEEYIAEDFPGYPLWICRFRENPISAEWTFWQYDHHGKVPGVRGDVDLNAFCGSRENWNRFLNGEIWPYTGDN